MAYGVPSAILLGLLAGVLVMSVQGKETATVGVSYHYNIMRRDFFNPIPSNSIYFKCSLSGKPGLPQWLKYTQKTATMDTAYLYGTPTEADVGKVSIEIVAFDSESYETQKQVMTITVMANENPDTHIVTVNVTNKDVEDMYTYDSAANTQSTNALLSAVKSIWPQAEDLTLVSLVSSLDAGGRVPIPGQPAGVVVQVGSVTPFSDTIEAAAANPCQADFMEFKDKGFTVDWCYFKAMVKEEGDGGDGDKLPPLVLGDVYIAPALTSGTRDLTTEFILIVIVPLVLAIILALLLSYIMCARREGVLKRDAVTPTTQLTHHAHIRQASKDLRDMSMRREGAQPLSTLPAFRLSPTPRGRGGRGAEPGTPPRDRDGPIDEQPMTSTPQPRGSAPPPYRLPPTFPAQEETSFINQPDEASGERRASEPAALQGKRDRSTQFPLTSI
ncbi:alpha-sarcoglycan-like isoform X2 [Ptychodera flava]|uniref:alpha-sarcoglycan-like isoform X2 n=1 Tax=Ptychodera flava TaxID=63121 RepID=UPI003969F427